MNRIIISTLCLFAALPLFAAEISNIPVTVTVTTVINRTTFTFEWNGKTVTHVDEVQLSCVTNRYKLTTKWERQ